MVIILGIGVDIIEIDRVVLATKNQRFIKKCFTQAEQKFCEKHKKSYASNFAAKEAFVKAVGTGFGKISPIMVEVLRDTKGRPYINLYDYAKEYATLLGVSKIHVSISHNKSDVIANVVLE